VTRVIRFGAGTLILAEVGIERAVLVATERGASVVESLPVVGAFAGVLPHVPAETVARAADVVESHRADGIVALGGGSAIDTAKAVVARMAGEDRLRLPRIVAVPTTYAGAEWTHYFGMLLGPGRKSGGADERARPVAAVYDPELTLGLGLQDTVGTAMNALAHCAEAFYFEPSTEDALAQAAAGAGAIGAALPDVVAEPGSLPHRTLLLDGAMHAALALADSGLCLGHAMAQGLGGRFGLPHGAMNALCLPAALRFNEPVVPEAIESFARALGVSDAAGRIEELARLGGFERLRDFGVPESELDSVAEAIAERPGAKANPRPADAVEIAGLLWGIW
jgi:maleylacetate reductase